MIEHDMQNSSSSTVVCCIESGPLEQMTLRMISSLRHFGGLLANAEVIAVYPRQGPRISSTTMQALSALNVNYVECKNNSVYSWNNFMNKPKALLYAEKYSSSETLLWLDSDILVTDCLGDLSLSHVQSTSLDTIQHHFAACPSDKNIGTTGTSDENDIFWQAICKELRIDIENLPWVETCTEKKVIRWYFNSGVFSFQRQSGFAQQFYDYCCTILDSHIASQKAGIFFTDQVCMGLAAYSLGLPTAILEHKFNFALGSRERNIQTDVVKNAAILHYHDALWPHEWYNTESLLLKYRPDVYDFIKKFGPLQSEKSLSHKILRKIISTSRAWKLKKHLSRCTFY
ncbi:MAG: hypothetical protein R3Y11_00160 [Pseudomonadota bacterium]